MQERNIVSIRVAEELKSLLRQKDYSLLTRLLLDFLTEEDFGKELLQQAIALREQYNLLAASGQESFKEFKEPLHQKLQLLLDSLQIGGLNLKPQRTHAEELYQKRLHDLAKDADSPSGDEFIVFRAKDLYKIYPNSQFRLGPIDLSLKNRQMTGVVGENGNGKTTLLRIIAGELAHSDGLLEYPTLEYKSWYEVKNQIAFVPQNIERWHGKLKENLHFSAANHGIFGQKNEELVDFIIHRLGLSRYANATWKEISSGYRLRFELARVLVWRPKLLILDEPLANLDINMKLMVLQDLKMLCQSKRYPLSIILSSQQLYEIERVVDDIIFIKDGQPLYNGSVKNIGSQRSSNAFELAGEFSREDLYGYLKDIEIISLTDAGNNFLLHVPIGVEGKDILEILNQYVRVEYFRDISRSSRKFFE